MVNPSFHIEEDKVRIIHDSKEIVIRACTGEQGENGPFACIELKDADQSEHRTIHSEDVFNQLFSFVESL